MWTFMEATHGQIIDTELNGIYNLYVAIKYGYDVCIMASVDGVNFLFFSRLKHAQMNEIKNLPKYIKFNIIYKPDSFKDNKIQIGYWKY